MTTPSSVRDDIQRFARDLVEAVRRRAPARDRAENIAAVAERLGDDVARLVIENSARGNAQMLRGGNLDLAAVAEIAKRPPRQLAKARREVRAERQCAPGPNEHVEDAV